MREAQGTRHGIRKKRDILMLTWKHTYFVALIIIINEVPLHLVEFLHHQLISRNPPSFLRHKYLDAEVSHNPHFLRPKT